MPLTKMTLRTHIQHELSQVALKNTASENAELLRKISDMLCDKMTKAEMTKLLYELRKDTGHERRRL